MLHRLDALAEALYARLQLLSVDTARWDSSTKTFAYVNLEGLGDHRIMIQLRQYKNEPGVRLNVAHYGLCELDNDPAHAERGHWIDLLTNPVSTLHPCCRAVYASEVRV